MLIFIWFFFIRTTSHQDSKFDCLDKKTCDSSDCTGPECSVLNCIGKNCKSGNCYGEECRAGNCNSYGCIAGSCFGKNCKPGICSYREPGCEGPNCKKCFDGKAYHLQRSIYHPISKRFPRNTILNKKLCKDKITRGDVINNKRIYNFRIKDATFYNAGKKTKESITSIKPLKDHEFRFIEKDLIIKTNPPIKINNNCDWCGKYKGQSICAHYMPVIANKETMDWQWIPDKGAVSENNKPNPMCYYAYTKHKGENIIKKNSEKYNYKYAILRYFNVAGASSSNEIGEIENSHGHLFKNLAIQSQKKNPVVNIYGSDYKTKDGTCIRDYIHVSDLADIHIKSIDVLKKKNKSLVLNCGYGKGFSVKDIVNIFKKIKKSCLIRYKGRRPGDIAQVYANTKKFKRILKWKPKYNNVKKILQSAINWEKKLKSNTNKSQY